MASLILNLDQSIHVTGTLDVFSAIPLDTQGHLMIENHPASTIRFNLSQAIAADSTSLALLISWLRSGHLFKKDIFFVNPSDSLYHLICFYKLEQILPFENHTEHNPS